VQTALDIDARKRGCRPRTAEREELLDEQVFEAFGAAGEEFHEIGG
jgi:hypothetical protein